MFLDTHILTKYLVMRYSQFDEECAYEKKCFMSETDLQLVKKFP